MWLEPGCWVAVFVKTMACCGCSFLLAQKNWYCPLLFRDFHPSKRNIARRGPDILAQSHFWLHAARFERWWCDFFQLPSHQKLHVISTISAKFLDFAFQWTIQLSLSFRYEEVKDYNFRRGGWQGGTGHFTQVVWKGTKELGMARAKTSDGGSTYVVGRYRPAGNVINFMEDNVFPRGGRWQAKEFWHLKCAKTQIPLVAKTTLSIFSNVFYPLRVVIRLNLKWYQRPAK